MRVGKRLLFCPNSFLPSLAQNFFLAFQPRGGDIWKISAQRAKLRGWRSEEMGFAGSASDWRKKKKAIEPCAGSQVSDFSTALFSSQFRLFAPWRFEVHSFRVLCFFFFSVSELEVHLMV